MEAILSIVGGGVACASTYWLGRRTGLRYRKMKTWVVRAAYLPGVLAGTVVCVFGALYAHTWLWVSGLGLMAGSLVGLRHGRKQADEERKAALKAEREAAERDAQGRSLA